MLFPLGWMVVVCAHRPVCWGGRNRFSHKGCRQCDTQMLKETLQLADQALIAQSGTPASQSGRSVLQYNAGLSLMYCSEVSLKEFHE
ncbi:MAG: hypothetical protein C0449_03825 [Polaromonas sp.]|nr:hypothetical protein [Polaromonas sp.]